MGAQTAGYRTTIQAFCLALATSAMAAAPDKEVTMSPSTKASPHRLRISLLGLAVAILTSSGCAVFSFRPVVVGGFSLFQIFS